MSTATTLAPSAASRRALARPIPLPAPVTTATRSRKRCMFLLCGFPSYFRFRFAVFQIFFRFRLLSPPSLAVPRLVLRGDEDVLDLGEGVGRVGAELAT